MLWLRQIVVVLLLALWGPATMHCTLESLPGFGFLQSCCGPDTSAPAAKDCQDDGCGEIESGLYKIEEQPGLLGSAPVLAVLPAPAPPRLLVPVLTSGCPPAAPNPPGLAQNWRFLQRAAPPPRAPSHPA